ncbi:MAG: glycogen-binding domain-containing protein [Gemmatimonadota bacterium]|nr:glycogen-binding domain-containing protein [Gemmatimonadota bacterium]
MSGTRDWSPEAQRYLDGDGALPADAGEAARVAAFQAAVDDWAGTVRAPDAALDARLMETVRARAAAGAPATQRAWWRWFVEPHQIAVRPAFAAAAAVALIAVSSAVAFLLDAPDPTPVPMATGTNAGTILVRFELRAPDARHVALAGSFNGWNDSTVVFSQAAEAGLWTVTVALRPGEYQYLFVVDGERWMPDPAAHAQVQDEFGQTNSLLVVGPRGVVRS